MDRRACLQDLVASRLLTDQQLARFGGDDKSDDDLLASLVQEAVLTPFQAERIRAGDGKFLMLGQYRILEELGRGGYGRVYKARHELMGRIVALKVIAPQLIEDERARAWFRREVVAVTQLSHPNIVAAFDANDIDGSLFFAMEFIDGPTLDGLVRESGPLAISLACDMLHQSAKALQFAHEHGMVHRDLKPANLLIPRAAVAQVLANPNLRPKPALVKIVDFGLARLGNAPTGQTLNLRNERGFVGTPDYVSPEQARNVHQVDIRSDLYSLGCTFYFALSGRRPFRAETPLEVIVQHLEAEPEPLEVFRPDVPAPLAGIIRRMMAKKPERRFQTPAELLAELTFFFGGEHDAAAGSGFLHRPSVGSVSSRIPGGARVTGRPQDWPSAARADATPPPAATVELPGLTPPEQPGVAQPKPEPGGVVSAELPRPVAPPDWSVPQPALQTADPVLREAWRAWTSVIAEQLREGRCAMAETDYQALHGGLLHCCRVHAAKTDGTGQAVYRNLEEMVEPWLSLKALANVDRKTLADVLARCELVGRNFAVARPNISAWAGLAAGLLAALFLGWLITTIQGRPPALDASLARNVWQALQDHPVISLALTLPTLAFAALALFARLLRP